MFILQDGKLHIPTRGNEIVGVNITHDNITQVKGSEVKLGLHERLTTYEVKCRYQINEENDYKFPIKKEVKKEVEKDESTSKTKKSSGKSK